MAARGRLPSAPCLPDPDSETELVPEPEPEGDAEPAAGVVFLLLLPVLPSPTMSGL